jgi:chemotaxis protein MotB
MARVKRYLDSRATDSHERWLVSYADFITLLFAFFVVMYAISSVNEGRYRVLGSAIGTAFRIAEPQALRDGVQVVQGPLVVAPRIGARASAWRRHDQRSARTSAALLAALKPLADAGQAEVRRSGRGVVVDIGAGALFASGEAQLQPAARAPLAAVAQVLAGLEAPVEVEGHTDNEPIQSARFPSNWDLSAARAGRVARLLQEHGVAPGRLAAIGYAEFRPLDGNDSAEGRARNRRVSIVVVDPEPGSAGEPGREAAPRGDPPMEFKVQPAR